MVQLSVPDMGPNNNKASFLSEQKFTEIWDDFGEAHQQPVISQQIVPTGSPLSPNALYDAHRFDNTEVGAAATSPMSSGDGEQQ